MVLKNKKNHKNTALSFTVVVTAVRVAIISRSSISDNI